MKRTILLFLVLGVSATYFGCKNEKGTTPQKTEFTGTSAPVAIVDLGKTTVLPNGNVLMEGIKYEWYDSTSVWQATGQSIWYENWLIYSSGDTIKIWGIADINVAGENPGDPSRGKWELLWNGWVTQYEMDEKGNFTKGLIAVDACGNGTSGAVEGMLGQWKYSMDIEQEFVYHNTGFFK